MTRLAFLAALLAAPLWCAGAAAAPKGRALADMPWTDAKKLLGADTVVVIPLGAGAKEHGPHLPLSADLIQAEWLTAKIMDVADVVVAPPVTYGFYPAFVEYPGSTTLQQSTARDMIVDIVRGLSKHGPRKFYVVNIGISTNKPLAEAQAILGVEGIAFKYLNLLSPEMEAIAKPLAKQREGTHADELETSLLLHMKPSVVNMKQAVAEYGPGAQPRGPFSPDPKSPRPSPSGIYGDATLATAAKGKALADAIVKLVLADVDALHKSPPPAPAPIYGNLPPPVPWPRPASPPPPR